MTQGTCDPGRDENGKHVPDSMAGELRRQCERLRQLAEKLQAREQALAEMQANYLHLRTYAYAKLREEFACTLQELPDKDLENLAREQGALPLEAFLPEIEA